MVMGVRGLFMGYGNTLYVIEYHARCLGDKYWRKVG